MYETIRPHFERLDALIGGLETRSGPEYATLNAIVSQMNLLDLNRAIYRCDAEERDMGLGSGVYDVPGYGRLVYCGTQGFVSVLAEIAPNNDLGHPFCGNLRDGNWMIGEFINICKEGNRPLNILLHGAGWRKRSAFAGWGIKV